jgi:WhiB family transcriptional regulator, redox-sensing transcriptional regulator
MGSAQATEAGPPGERKRFPHPGAIEHDWMEDGSCTSRLDVQFFPGSGQRAAPAKVVCQECPVQLRCLDYAITNEILDGVWGGLSPDERTTIILRRRRTRAAGE